MSPETPGIFALPDHLAHKADPGHIADDERHLAAVSRALDQKVAFLSARLDARRRDPAGRGAQKASDSGVGAVPVMASRHRLP